MQYRNIYIWLNYYCTLIAISCARETLNISLIEWLSELPLALLDYGTFNV